MTLTPLTARQLPATVDTQRPFQADRSAGHELGVAREILAGLLRNIPAKYLTLDSRVNSLVSCADLTALRDRLDTAAATLDRETAKGWAGPRFQEPRGIELTAKGKAAVRFQESDL